MEAIPKSDIKSDIRFGNRFDIRLKQTTWIGHKRGQRRAFLDHLPFLFHVVIERPLTPTHQIEIS